MTYEFQHVQSSNFNCLNFDPRQKLYYSSPIRSHNTVIEKCETPSEKCFVRINLLAMCTLNRKVFWRKKLFCEISFLKYGKMIFTIEYYRLFELIEVRRIEHILSITTTSFNYLLRCRRLASRTIRELLTSLIFSSKEGDCNLPDGKYKQRNEHHRLKLRSMICLGEKNSHRKNFKQHWKAFTFV